MRLEAMAIRLEAMAMRLEAMAIRLEACKYVSDRAWAVNLYCAFGVGTMCLHPCHAILS